VTVNWVAFVDDQVSVALPPLVISAGDAWSVTVGAAGAGGTGAGAAGALATLLWQPAKKMTALKRRIAIFALGLSVFMDSSES
jgi:hypothetical protein